MRKKLEFSDRIKKVPKSFLREIFSVIQDDNIISFAGGLPSPDLFPIENFKDASVKVLTEHGKEALQYAGSEGFLPLRQYICDQYKKKEGIDVKPEEILITNGSQQALDLLGKVLVNNDDSIIIENPTYLAAIQSLSLYSPKFIAVSSDTGGPNIQNLTRILIDTIPKFFYGIPNFQNPTGITWTDKKRKKVANLLRESNTLFIEDDPYGEIRWSGKRPCSMMGLLGEQSVLLGSFSKTVAPGLRLGWVYTPNKELYNKLYIAKQASDLHTNTFNQQILYEYLSHGTSDDHIAKIAKAYGLQKDAMINAIKKFLPKSVAYTNPDGGMFLWLTFPDNIDTLSLFKFAVSEGVAFVPGFAFYADSKKAPKNTARFNFSNASIADINNGVKHLSRAYKKYVAQIK